MNTPILDENELITDIERKRTTGEVSTTTLRTDDRVLARITDGIYRQPASALRELISNAYDADATNVIIQTDAPRFEQITIRDDGNGMNIQTLARLIHHIGGSTKRRFEGASLNTTSEDDASLSPSGRKLIGKIGIGLFSVSQLTRHFQIVTKVLGNDYRLVAEVILSTYTEEQTTKKLAEAEFSTQKVETGTVNIISVPAVDVDAHGTEIVLLDLRPQAKELLQSKQTWDSVGNGSTDEPSMTPQVQSPIFHIGQFDKNSEMVLRPAKLPWAANDKPEDRFLKLYQSVIDQISTVARNPRLEETFDNYLRMLWTLSLAAPINYIDGHPFDLVPDPELSFYQLTPEKPGQAKLLNLIPGQRLRERLELHAPQRGESNLAFRVLIDDVELLRPIRFHNLPETNQAIKSPMVFMGKAAPDLSNISKQERGGDLAFEAYFLWSPKIVPKENNGLLIRINDASGTGFDETFCKYQVSEQNRLSQITAEIFVSKGLDAALNIDRESFNTSHPHYQFIARWVHRALRQIVNTLKQVAIERRNEVLAKVYTEQSAALQQVVQQEVNRAVGQNDFEPIDVELSYGNTAVIAEERKKGRLALNATTILAPLPKASNTRGQSEQELFKQQIEAVGTILGAYGLLENLNYERQEELLRAIVAVFASK